MALLDPYGRALPSSAPAVAAVPPPLFDEYSADTPREGVADAYVDELRRARDEVLEMQGRGDLKIYERLMADDQVMPCFKQRRAAVTARELKVEPGGPTELDAQAADDLRAQLKSVAWDRVTDRMLIGLMYGRSHAECMFRREGTRVVLDAIKVRRAKRFAFDKHKRLVLLRGTERILLPERKFWSVTFGAEDDDDVCGRGLGLFLYWPVWFKRNGERFWAIWLETLAQPTPKAEVPPGTPPKKQREMMALLDAIRAGGKIVHPRGTLISFLESVRNSGGDYAVFIELQDRRIAKIILQQTMTTDAASTGLGSTQGEVQERIGNTGAKSESDILTESFGKGPATWLTQWNYPGAKTPILYRDFGQQKDLTAAADRDTKLTSIGYRPTADRIRETYGDGYEPVAAPAPTPPTGDPAAAFREPVGDVADGAVDRVLDHGGWRRAMAPQVDEIEGLLNDAPSLESVRDRLGELAAKPPRELADELSRIIFSAQLQGSVGADEPELGD